LQPYVFQLAHVAALPCLNPQHNFFYFTGIARELGGTLTGIWQDLGNSLAGFCPDSGCRLARVWQESGRILARAWQAFATISSQIYSATVKEVAKNAVFLFVPKQHTSCS